MQYLIEGESRHVLGSFRADATSVLHQAANQLGYSPITIIGEGRKVLIETSRSRHPEIISVSKGSVFAIVKIPDKICPVTNKPCDRIAYPFLNKVIELYSKATELSSAA